MVIQPLQFIDEQPPGLEATSDEVTVWRDAAGEEVAFCATYEPWHWMRVVGAGSFRFPTQPQDLAVAAQVVPDRRSSPRVVTDSYYRTIVPLALQVYGLETLHGSAVCLPRGVVALCADPESGKSTIAFAMRERGHEAVADDSVVVSIEPTADVTAAEGIEVGRPLIYPVPFALRLREPSAEHFASPSKATVLVGGDSGPIAIGEPQPLAAVVMLSRHRSPAYGGVDTQESAGTGPLVTRLPSNEAFTALLSQSLVFTMVDKQRRRKMIRSYLRLADVIPVYRLSYPTGLEHLGAICDLLEELGARGDI